MSINSLPFKPLFPLSRNSSLDENYPIKKRKSPVKQGVSIEKHLKIDLKPEEKREEKRVAIPNIVKQEPFQPPNTKKELKNYEKFLNKLKQQRKHEFISLDSCIKNNKLSFLPYIRCQDSQLFYNMIIPVLPKALFQDQQP